MDLRKGNYLLMAGLFVGILAAVFLGWILWKDYQFRQGEQWVKDVAEILERAEQE